MSLKVLIAHGNTQRLKQAVADLHAAGFDVIATPDGGDAFARFFEDEPDLVICSARLPGLAGTNIAKMVHSQSPNTPVVLLIDEASEPVGDDAVALMDPLDLSALREVLPQIHFDLPSEPAAVEREGGDAGVNKVFVVAVLKRFQRDNAALGVLDDVGIGRMAAIAEYRAFSDGDQIVRQGDPGDGFYLVVEGQVKVTLAEKGDQEVARINAGGFFGEMALIADKRRSASVWSLGSTTLLWFEREAFLPLLGDYPRLRDALSGVAQKRSEENLWRVLFDDDDVQRSIAQLGGDDDVSITVVEEEGAPSPAAQPPRAVPAWLRRVSPETARIAAGVAAGFALGVCVTLLMARGPAAPMSEAMTALKPPPTASPSGSAPPAAAARAETVSAPFVATVTPPVSVVAAPAVPTGASSSPSISIAPASMAVTPPASAPASRPSDGAAIEDLGVAFKDKNYRLVLKLAAKLSPAAAAQDEPSFMIAEAARFTGLAAQALAGYQAYIARYPQTLRTDDAQFWAADLLRQQGKVAEARALYQKVADTPESNFKNSAMRRLAEP